MEFGSPANGFEELNDILKEDVPSLADELDPSYIVNKEENAAEYAFGNLASSNDFLEDLTQHEQQNPLSLPSDFSYYEFSGSPKKFLSPLQNGFDGVVLGERKFVSDEGRLLSSPKDYYHQEETEELGSSYLSRSSFLLELETMHDNIEAEVSGHLLESFSRTDATQEKEMEDRPASLSPVGMVEEAFFNTSKKELTTSDLADKVLEEEVLDLPADKLHTSLRSSVDNDETESEHNFYAKDSPPADDRELEMSHYDQLSPDRSLPISKSPERVRQMSFIHDMSPRAYLSPDSPKTTASQQSLQDLSYSSQSHRQKHGSSPERPDHLLVSDEKKSLSLGGSQQGMGHVDGSSVKHISASQGNHNSHLNHQRRVRSMSKSPVRLRESSSRHNREHRERSRSRSTHKRHYHRRSPRRRYSPRRRSPHSDYHSYHRSHRRPWAPPHNRSTGLGKPGRNLFVAGFSFLTTERDLERKFSRFGRVQDVRIVRDKRSGDSRGFGFLTLERDEEADAAITALDKTEWKGRIVLVEKSKPH